MSVASTDTWSQSRDEILADALANVGAIGPGREASGRERDFASRALNRIVKSLDSAGRFLWRTSRLTFATTDGDASYDLDATAFAIEEPMSYLPAGGTSRTLIYPMTIEEYRSLADRTTESKPTRYCIEKSLTGNGRALLSALLWPVPDTTGDTIEYLAHLRAKDLTTGAQTPDFPTNWIRGLVYGLTAEIGPAFGQSELAAEHRGLFEAEVQRQLGADNEMQGLTLVPWGGAW